MKRDCRILLAPLDPVHDVGIRMIGKGLVDKGYDAICLPPDVSVEEIVDGLVAYESACQPFVDLFRLQFQTNAPLNEVWDSHCGRMEAHGVGH